MPNQNFILSFLIIVYDYTIILSPLTYCYNEWKVLNLCYFKNNSPTIINHIIILNKKWINQKSREHDTHTNLMCKSKRVRFFFCLAMMNNKTQLLIKSLTTILQSLRVCINKMILELHDMHKEFVPDHTFHSWNTPL